MLPRYYDLLSLHPDATVEDITKARDVLLAKYEPHARLGDRDAVRLVRAIEEAAATLADPTRRAAYHAALLTVTAPDPGLPSPFAPDTSRRPDTAPRPLSLPSPAPGQMTLDYRPAPPALPAGTQSALQPTVPSLAGQRTLAGPQAPLTNHSATSEDLPPAPILFFLMLLDWFARRALAVKDSVGRVGEVVGESEAALPPATLDSVKVNAADWHFNIHDAFYAPYLAINGQRLAPHGQWLLVRLGVRNDWGGHRALRAEDFGLIVASEAVRQTSQVYNLAMHLEATHAARLSLGLKATPAGRHGLGFATRETKETVVAFDVPLEPGDVFLRLKPAGAMVDLAPVAAMPMLSAAPVAAVIDGRTTDRPTPARLEILAIHTTPNQGRSKQVTVTARATPGATCHIRVQYARGPSHARSLAPAVAGPDGVVRWSWRITARTRPGEWPVTVACGYTHALTTLVIDQPRPDAV